MNITIIYGPPSSGKTQKARGLAKHKKDSYICFSDSNIVIPNAFMGGVDPDCEILIIDECPDNIVYNAYLNRVRSGFSLNRKGKNLVHINPEIVLIMEGKPKLDSRHLRSVRFIEMKGSLKSKDTAIDLNPTVEITQLEYIYLLSLIQTWHDFPSKSTDEETQKIWELYKGNSPEMKVVRDIEKRLDNLTSERKIKGNHPDRVAKRIYTRMLSAANSDLMSACEASAKECSLIAVDEMVDFQKEYTTINVRSPQLELELIKQGIERIQYPF